MGLTIIEKIISRNVGHDVKPGDIVTVNVDRVMIHDIFIPFVAEKFEEMGFTGLWDPDKVVMIYDHLVPASQQDDVRHYQVVWLSVPKTTFPGFTYPASVMSWWQIPSLL